MLMIVSEVSETVPHKKENLGVCIKFVVQIGFDSHHVGEILLCRFKSFID